MRTTDKGLQKAIKRQPHYELPSNFSYRMMQKIQEESILREKRQEKRMFILFLVFAILSGGKLHRIFYMEIRSSLHQLLAHLQGNTSGLLYAPFLPTYALCPLSAVLLRPMATKENA